ncbi:MAG: Re/Si-specific NAD(P)(+) transhydrogenase subunit alpha [Deltaproteobacteria bacterium]|nr:Re/Si-specific NAD(P)(+) transhydrogenase subunit alpha [Deltaproteobacteria bacterium]
MPTVFVPKESRDGETRVAATPETVKALVKEGFEVLMEPSAGAGAYFADQSYLDAGASTATDAASARGAADVIMMVNPPTPDEARNLKEGAVLVSLLWPLSNTDVVGVLRDRKVTAFALDRIPRISRAQGMDALSSQSNIAGYKAVLLAAQSLPRLMPLMMTAAGTIKPARVVVLGAGVAGLQAIATARRLGAVVEVSDVRSAVKEQVMSLGGRFIEVEGMEDLEDAGGYAREASKEFLERQKALVRKHIVNADAVITTALIPGKPAPRLISADVVREMKNGSVIVDMAVEQGGNCELSENGRDVVREGVNIIGRPNIPALVPTHASEVFARNVLAVTRHLFPKAEPNLDFDDEINDGAIVVHAGVVRDDAVAAALDGGDK